MKEADDNVIMGNQLILPVHQETHLQDSLSDEDR